MNKGLRTALIITGILLLVMSIAFGILGAIFGWQYEGWGWDMMGPGMMGGFGFMGFMGIFWIVILGLIIWAVAAAVHKPDQNGNQGSGSGTDSALDILKKRYARGEIDKNEYEDKKRDLT